MIMSFRWFGKNADPVSLKYIRQIPGMKAVVSALNTIPVGEVWSMDDILELKREIEAQDLLFQTIESVNVHEDIKLGLATRDRYIENYRQTLRNLSRAGIKVVCYNFMPVFDWLRTDLAQILEDGSNTMAYDEKVIRDLTPDKLMQSMVAGSKGFELAGWEKDRLHELEKLFALYKDINEDKLFEHLGYFLHSIIPTAEECGIKMAIHPDDPPWTVFGLPRIVTCKKNLERIVNLVDSPSNGLTICTGSLGANPANRMPDIIRYFGKMGRVHFGHVRNIRIESSGVFYETSHKDDSGSIDVYEVMKAFHDIGFTGPIRPDHGRMIWDEAGRPGYGLYDRALGAVYLQGLWDSMERGVDKYE